VVTSKRDDPLLDGSSLLKVAVVVPVTRPNEAPTQVIRTVC